MRRRGFTAGMIVLGSGFAFDMSDRTAADLKIAIGSAELPLNGGGDALARAIERYNRRASLDGLPDRLNPLTLDEAKVLVFLRRLPELPKATLNALPAEPLDLTTPALGLHSSDPVSRETLERGFDLEIRRKGRDDREVRLKIEKDPELAESLSREAREATARFDQEVRTLAHSEQQRSRTPKERSTWLDELALARWKRYAAAQVWRVNADFAAALHPRDTARAKTAREARSAELKYLQPSWVGLPDPK